MAGRGGRGAFPGPAALGWRGPPAATVAAGGGAEQGGALLQVLCPESLGCLCGYPLAFPPGGFPAPDALKQHQGFCKPRAACLYVILIAELEW